LMNILHQVGEIPKKNIQVISFKVMRSLVNVLMRRPRNTLIEFLGAAFSEPPISQYAPSYLHMPSVRELKKLVKVVHRSGGHPTAFSDSATLPGAPQTLVSRLGVMQGFTRARSLVRRSCHGLYPLTSHFGANVPAAGFVVDAVTVFSPHLSVSLRWSIIPIYKPISCFVKPISCFVKPISCFVKPISCFA
jgi:hypothetical protein